jgi:hypothetical protein
MNTYRLRIQQQYWGFTPQCAPESPKADVRVAALPGAVIREFSDAGNWVENLDVALQRSSHLQALNEILFVLEQSGYSVLNGEVTEWASSSAEGAVTGLLGGGLLGTKAKDPLVALAAAGIGMLVGSIVGSNLKRVEKVYELQRTFAGGWTLVEVPLAEATPWGQAA